MAAFVGFMTTINVTEAAEKLPKLNPDFKPESGEEGEKLVLSVSVIRVYSF